MFMPYPKNRNRGVIAMAFWKKNRKREPEELPEEKKAGLIRRLYLKIKSIDWKNPLNRWKLLFASLFSLLILMGFVGGAIAYTSTQSFCSVCHEMAAEHVTTQAGAHSEIQCTQCHIEPGAVNLVVHKVMSLKEVYYHIIGPPDPIVQTVGVLDENCKQCHSKNRLVSATGDLIVNHDGHIDEGIPCISCHAGVAHAKVVERGINDSTTYDAWTKDNAKKLMGKQYMSPNMGTCIDCHDKVNQGEKPWKDEAYSLPENPHKEQAGESDSNDGHKVEAAENKNETEKNAHERTQDIILQAIGQQKADVKLSMECFTCHQEINTPKNHDNEVWNQSHGDFALGELDQCINCHQDAKWVRKFEKQDIEELLKGSQEKEQYTQNMVIVKEESRQNHFCSTCHANRPPGHLDSDTWLTAHAPKAQTNEEKAGCYVCHDKEKAEGSTEGTHATTEVYCQFCHRTGFKSEKL
jgi:nitrate/TMAO reductase-like tetraheme cytochrome c subunit